MEKNWIEIDLRQVRDPDAADLVGDTVVSQDINPSLDVSLLPEKL